jgi:hypothetical protein
VLQARNTAKAGIFHEARACTSQAESQGPGAFQHEAAFSMARLLEDMSMKRLQSLGEDMSKLPGPEFDRLRETLAAAAAIHLKLAEFAFPKLARIDVAGEAPSVPHHKMVFTLNIARPTGANGAIEHNADLPLGDGCDDPELPVKP